MAHRIGPAKSPVSDKFAKRGIVIGLVILAFSLLMPTQSCDGKGESESGSGDGAIAQPLADCSPMLPVSAAPPLYFEKGQKSVTVTLRHDMWSREIVTPADSVDYRIDVEPRNGYLVLFKDGTVGEVSADQLEMADFGVRRGIFRILGNTPGQTAVVTVSFQSRD